MDMPSDNSWDEVAAEWLDTKPHQLWRRHSDNVAIRLLAKWLPKSCEAVLKTDLFDEAVGAGQYEPLSARCGQVHGVDIAPRVVAAANWQYPDLKGLVADVRSLPYAAGRFDAVVSLSSLDHFASKTDIAVSLTEIRRVLAPGGRLILTLDNPANPFVALRQAMPMKRLNRIGLVPYYCGPTLPPRRLAAAARQAGFTILEQTATIHCPRVLAVSLAKWLNRRGGSRGHETFLRAAGGFEHLSRLPTRWLTGHFSVVIANADA